MNDQAERVWMAVITTLAPILATIASGVFLWMKARAAAIAAEAAVKTAKIAADMAAHNAAIAQKSQAENEARASALAHKVDTLGAHQKEIVAKVEQVQKATDGLTDRLVDATDKEAYQRGTTEERQRAADEANGGKGE